MLSSLLKPVLVARRVEKVKKQGPENQQVNHDMDISMPP
jgi:hypothetical protein